MQNFVSVTEQLPQDEPGRNTKQEVEALIHQKYFMSLEIKTNKL